PAMMLVTQIRSANEDLKNLVTREAEIEGQIKLYEQRVENTPKREQEMVTIQRDYDNISRSYQALLSKKLNAEISENLEKRQKGEQFRIIDPANLPEKPIKPNKFLVLLIGTGVGMGLGIAFAFVREQFDNSIRKPEEVERITSVLVLAVIPDFEDEIKQKQKSKTQKVVNIEQFSGRKQFLKRGGVKGR
ncbi:MAG: GNVR domain-containing protein, partial [Nitrospiria bacterium]